MFRGRTPTVHFVGIGGIGMSGIAEILLELGYPVTGSDLKESDVTRRLAGKGARIVEGHAAGNVGASDVVVVTSAAKRDNPELVEARRRGIPVIPRAEMLAELLRLKTGIAVAGSHGKTTTTSMIAHLLAEAGLDPTVVVGGKLNNLGSNARLGRSEYMVVEADESDGSFLRFRPAIAAITNVDPEHLDHYGSFEALRRAFLDFANQVPFYGLAVLCLDHPVVRDLVPALDRRWVTYGFTRGADYRADELAIHGAEVRFRVHRRGEDLGRFLLHMVGEHNVQNALAALAVADDLGVPLETARAALSTFSGVQRRFTVLGEAGGVTVVDDYGHHPAELAATFRGARRSYAGRRIVVAFQPHRYTRTRDLLGEFAASFGDVDAVLVTDVYAASEEPIPGATGASLAEAVRATGHRDVSFVPRAALLDTLASRVRAGDLVLLQGAGDVNAIGAPLLARLRG